MRHLHKSARPGASADESKTESQSVQRFLDVLARLVARRHVRTVLAPEGATRNPARQPADVPPAKT